MRGWIWLFAVLAVGAFIGSRWPQTNVIERVIGGGGDGGDMDG